MESSANSRSVMPRVMTTNAIGVSRRLPFSEMKNLTPFHSSLTGRCWRTQRNSRGYAEPPLRPPAGKVYRREPQESAEQVEHPAELVDRGGADGDEDAAHDQGQDDADH